MQKASIKEFRTLGPYLKRYTGQYLVGFFFLVLVDICQIFIPQCIRRAVDLISSGTFDLKSIYMLSGAIVVLALVISGGRFLWRYFIHGSARRIETEIRDKLFAHMLTLSYDFYQKNKIGDLMARATNDLNAVRMAIGMGLVSFIDGTVMAAAVLVIIFIQNPQTAAFAVLPLPLITILIMLFGGAVGRRFFRVQETYSAMSDTVQETFAGIRVIKSFVKEWWFIKKFADTNEDYKQANMVLVRIFGVFFPLISFLSGLTTIIILLVGGSKVIEGTMSAGDLAAFFMYMQMLIWPMLGIGFTINMMQRGAVSLARINAIFNEKPSIASPEFPVNPETVPLSSADPAIQVTKMDFTYKTEAEDGKVPEQVLRDVNACIRNGMIVGVLGKTGSGKSTFLKTLMRMIDPPSGTVFVKNIDVRDWDLAELRKQYGVTPQDTYLFSDSIKNNIAYGIENSGEENDAVLLEAAELSAIAGDLKEFTNGWDTVVGERGLTLSGGQKQRVAIARALARDPEILVLDDALSAVDAETERRILDNLMEKRKGRTTIIVSHRVSTLQNTDYVIVLENGRISESGTPGQLMIHKGFFARMAQLQRLEGPDGTAEFGGDPEEING
ncbi:ABC transporter ATP-binding protein/permease [Brucepastera parasyntrophica]|uniref:ABC transporter ATP-binding protein n=1 Tax=Brucepastera parasyntrophica TaxID=2880008 RepID=UPI0021086C66|nr:ABC transporter ATP-binding protein [Brucepastera parasyntrophica]ULQ59652.1 ABC transporter ATP-binding protein/permease [Brucepastera parasyntrophica]